MHQGILSPRKTCTNLISASAVWDFESDNQMLCDIPEPIIITLTIRQN
jgi:hypothetical protein